MNCNCTHEKVYQNRRNIDIATRPILEKATDQDKVAEVVRQLCQNREAKDES